AARFAIGFSGGKKHDETEAAIKRMFTPEFRNRLDATVAFGGLTPEIIDRVVEKFILQLEVQLADRGVTFELSTEATRWLAKRGFDEEMGARPLGRVIQEYVKKPIADEILFGRLKNGGIVKVMLDATDTEKLAFEFIPDTTKKETAIPALVAP
ncbi:MAG: ATP-dependent Clp protease ATP-binding subunit ClpA, partial [Pseudomonadota bacterium]